ncbi:MAG: NRDE family protein [bacterium]|nr:MAG: NRDE family protein [bacterium]
MCNIVFAYGAQPGYRLILAGNRDEFYDRPTEPAGFWPEHPRLLAGRDVRYGGTWLGITLEGRFGAVTNFRDPGSQRDHLLSRGLMLTDYLLGVKDPETFLADLDRAGDRYNGFNVLLDDSSGLFYYSNRNRRWRELDKGIYGLSNHLLDTPWPKVMRIKALFRDILDRETHPSVDSLMTVLADRVRPADQTLPDTGVGVDWERVLSPVFITSPNYGTRSSTVLTIRDTGEVRFTERSFTSPDDPGTDVEWAFTLGR